MAILIVGATATVGQAAGATIVEGDLTQPSTLKAASAGTATIVCTATSMPKAAR
jgi:uncharacterized protein YbjT (DUF2867 family)